MCGIIGIVNNKKLFKQAFNALRSLEYRGYDSFGFGALSEQSIHTVKRVGAISETCTDDFAAFTDLHTIIGHTRWATHGGVTEPNSHPHLSTDGRVGIVHNGVIANFARLVADNPQWQLRSETDTEAAANVIADLLAQHPNDMVAALAAALRKLEGEFAICGVLVDKPSTMFALKRKSPLAVGKLDGGIVFSSDRTAFCEFAQQMDLLHLEDDTLLLYHDHTTQLYHLQNNTLVECTLEYQHESLEGQAADLAGFPHYMLKEIHESPAAMQTMMQNLENLKVPLVNEMLLSDLSMTGSGSAYYVTMMGQYFFNAIGGTYVPTHSSDEYLNLKSLSRRDLILAVSQSGETFDTLEVLRHGKEKKAAIVCINNVQKCSMQRLADVAVYQGAGKEVCVLSTKSVISQVSGLYLLAVEMGLRTGKLTEKSYSQLLGDYDEMPDVLNAVISDYADEIKRIAYQNCTIAHWFFIGRGAHYPVGLESALKFKEVSYLHAEGMPAGFFKHGTISLIDKYFYTVVFLPSPINAHDLYQATIDNIYEIRARGGHVIGIGHQLPKSIVNELFFEYITLPDVNPHLNILLQLLAGQLLAYYSAVALNRNIDKPRALAKSVTVR